MPFQETFLIHEKFGYYKNECNEWTVQMLSCYHQNIALCFNTSINITQLS